MDTAALHAELTTDPMSVGYASALSAGNDAHCAAMLNALTGPGAGNVTLSSMSHDEFALMIAPAVFALGQSTQTLQTKWTPMLNLISGVTTVDLNPSILGIVGQLVTDGLMAQAQIDDGITRPGSRAEILWGVGTVVQWIDVAHAMGRGL